MTKEQYQQKYIPNEVTLELTEACNFNCVHCYLKHDEIGTLLSEDYRAILDDLSALGCFCIQLTGGEVFCRKKLLFEIIDYAKTKSFLFSIFSNISLCDFSDLDKLMHMGIHRLHISLYGNSAGTYKHLCGINLNPILIKDRILYAKKIGINVHVSITVLEQNYQDVDSLCQWCSENEISYALSYVLIGAQIKEHRNLISAVSEKQLEECMKTHDFSYCNYIEKMKGRKSSYRFCSAARTKACISSDGTVYPCATWRQSLGNVKDGFQQVWSLENPTIKEIRSLEINMSPCFECEIFDVCSFCPGMNYAMHNSPLLPARQVCLLSRVLKKIYG
jgi:radical SAM protein with 4Fe4S-binding SPASM domain